jgi:elongator complex protein 5
MKREATGADASAQDGPQSTFSLTLTERQRMEREGVVLPYFDAQMAGTTGEGGRILYDMGIEDDFDDEEDDI